MIFYNKLVRGGVIVVTIIFCFHDIVHYNTIFVSFPAMMLGSLKAPYIKIKEWLLQVDEKRLTASMIEQLVKYTPDREVMEEFGRLRDDYDSLSEPEQFLVTVSILL